MTTTTVPSGTVTTREIEVKMRAEIKRATHDVFNAPDHLLVEAFRLGQDIGYTKAAVRRIAWGYDK